MALQNSGIDDLCEDFDTPSDILSAYPNFAPGHSLLAPSRGPVSIGWGNHKVKNVIQSQSEWSSVVGETIGISQGLGEWNGTEVDSFRSGNRAVGGTIEGPDSFISRPSVLVDPPSDMLLSANDDMENFSGGLSSEDVENELRVCSSVNSTIGSDVKFVVKECEKKRNPPYLLDGSNITTKNKTPVKFHLIGAVTGQEAKITLRYADPLKHGLPVKVCKEHRCDVAANDPKDEFTFRIITLKEECRYEILDGHCTAIIPVREASKFMEFYIEFICLNSCHRNQHKNIDLLMTLVDQASQNFESETQFSIRVCKNVKRDHKDRKRSLEEVAAEVPEKCVKQEPAMMCCDEYPGSSPHMIEEKSGSSREPITVFMNPDDKVLVLPLLRRLNIPVMQHGLDLCNPELGNSGLTSDN